MGACPARESVLNLKNAIENVGTKVNIVANPVMANKNTDLTLIEHDTPWMRDVSPCFTWKNDIHVPHYGLHWVNQGSGSLRDARIPSALLFTMNIPIMSCTGINMDPSMFVTNGHGIFVISYDLFSEKNPTMERRDAEYLLRRAVMVKNVIWIKGKMNSIDDVLNFIDEDNAIVNWTENKSDVLHNMFKNTVIQLERAGLNAWRVSIPSHKYRSSEEAMGTSNYGGKRLSMGYASFFYGKEGVVVPQYGDYYIDEQAKMLFNFLSNGKKVECVDAMEIAIGGGTIRRITGCY